MGIFGKTGRQARAERAAAPPAPAPSAAPARPGAVAPARPPAGRPASSAPRRRSRARSPGREHRGRGRRSRARSASPATCGWRPGGIVKATVYAQSVVVAGELVGDCHATQRVEIQASGRLTGNIRAPRVVIAEGATFKGNSDMTPAGEGEKA